MSTIAETEPTCFTIGDAVRWTRSIADYPAPDFSLKYAFVALGKTKVTVESAADGTAHAIELDSSEFTAGVYDYQVYAVAAGTGDRFTIGQGTLRALADFESSSNTLDTRSHARRTLDIIEAALENRLPRGLENYSVSGMSVSKISLAELRRLRDVYADEVAAEENAASGGAARKNIVFRFDAP